MVTDDTINYKTVKNSWIWTSNSDSTTATMGADTSSYGDYQATIVADFYGNTTANIGDIYYKHILDTTTIRDNWKSYGTSSTSSSNWYWDEWKKATLIVSPHDRIREIIRARQAPLIIGTRKPMKAAPNPTEARARETLLRVLGEEKFRGFLRNGFVSVRGKSGMVYQIFPGHDMTKVYQHGKLIEKLCVVLSGSFPPTDALIMRFLLILNDEKEFRNLANTFSAGRVSRNRRTVDMRPLPEIFKSLLAA